MKILVATNNQNKQKEFLKILEQNNLTVIFPGDVGLGKLDVPEIGLTYSANAQLKAEAFAKRSELLTLADDTGLEIVALGGKPGVNTKRFFGKSDFQRNEEFIRRLQGESDRRAQAVCVLCLYNPQTKKSDFFKGVLKGKMATSQRGAIGFGFDRTLIPEGQSKTLAELGIEYKNRFGHRAIALELLLKRLSDQ